MTRPVMDTNRDNCVRSIANLIKVRTQNSSVFAEMRGANKIMQIMLEDCSEEIFEKCACILK
jgi:hypothetical protein